MKLCKIVQYDNRQHIWKNRFFLLVPFIIFLYCLRVEAQIFNIDFTQSATFGDYFLAVFKGCEPMAASDETRIPVFWLIVMIVPLFLANGFVQKDLQGFGLQIFIRMKNKSRWWFSKCITCFLFSVYYYIILLLSMFLFCICNGVVISFKITEHIAAELLTEEYFTRQSDFTMNTVQQLVMLYIIPFLVICCLNFIQMTISLFVKPIVGFMLVNAYILLAAYISTPFSIAEYAMLGHSDLYMADGLSHMTGITACIGIIILMILTGMYFFQNKDIL